jgi:hypothetical protein
MNGRLYDPVIARFISADPYVQDGSDTQGTNRYSYVGNNPLNTVDPSGFIAMKVELYQRNYMEEVGHRGLGSGCEKGPGGECLFKAQGGRQIPSWLVGGDASDSSDGGKKLWLGERGIISENYDQIVITGTSEKNRLKSETQQVDSAVSTYQKCETTSCVIAAAGAMNDLYARLRSSGSQMHSSSMLELGANKAQANVRSGNTKSAVNQAGIVGVAGVGTKFVPNPFGKNGGPAHQSKVADVIANLRSRGLDFRVERQVMTPDGSKNSRYVDVVGVDPKSGAVVEMHQVGKQTMQGAPISRERRAMDDIQNATGMTPHFHPYN